MIYPYPVVALEPSESKPPFVHASVPCLGWGWARPDRPYRVLFDNGTPVSLSVKWIMLHASGAQLHAPDPEPRCRESICLGRRNVDKVMQHSAAACTMQHVACSLPGIPFTLDPLLWESLPISSGTVEIPHLFSFRSPDCRAYFLEAANCRLKWRIITSTRLKVETHPPWTTVDDTCSMKLSLLFSSPCGVPFPLPHPSLLGYKRRALGEHPVIGLASSAGHSTSTAEGQ